MSMIRTLARSLTYQRCAIILTGFSVVALYAAVVADQFRAAADPLGAMPPYSGAAAARPLIAKPVQVAMAGSAEKLFNLIGYRLDGVRRHGRVPRVFLANMPSKLPKIRLPGKRKVMFIKTALPLILHVNEVIQQDRAEIEMLYAKKKSGAQLSADETARMQAQAEAYGLDKADFVALLRRVDSIPPSLALAQSAEESGWGTSRFAQKGNALFGQRTFRGNKGLVPMKREKGQTYKVRAFDYLIDGVKSYARNLNTHFAYKEFRAVRAGLRKGGKALDGYKLAETLTAYSERGSAYVKSITAIIRVNKLDRFDKVRLGDRVSGGASGPDA